MPDLSPLDLTQSRVIFARSPAEEAIDLGIFATPLDVLSIAQLRHDAPELADRIAEAAGRQFDRTNANQKDAEGRIIAETLQRGE